MTTPDYMPVRMYHGTSTLFLDSIVGSGLAGFNPIERWNVLEFASMMYPFVEEHLSHEDDWRAKADSFEKMVEQRCAGMNFQHGDTYLSPAKSTAIRYAANKRVGSELLSYCLDLLQELVHRRIPSVTRDLYRQFPNVFSLLDISVAPVLIEVEINSPDDLLTECGKEASEMFAEVCALRKEEGESPILQQLNFRLCRPMPVSQLKVWLINVSRWHPLMPEYSLYALSLDDLAKP